MNGVVLAAALLLLWNLLTFLVTAWDKRAAKRGMRRVPEKQFVLFSVLLGGAGVLLAFYLFRHKTRHTGLLAKVWLFTALSYAAAIYIYSRI